MEEFSHRLLTCYSGPSHRLALTGSQWQLPWFLLRALAFARRHRDSIELVHLGDGLLTVFAGLFRRLSNAPVSATLHGRDVERRYVVYRTLLRRGLRAIDGPLVAVSSYTAGRVEALFGRAPVVVHNGVNASRFQPSMTGGTRDERRVRLGLSPSSPVIVTVGRLERRKGVCWFIEEVLPRLPEDVTYVVVGDGPYRREVARAAAGRPNVRLLGSLADEQVGLLFSCADLFVAPNVFIPRDPEGYGIAPAEAAAVGVPVLVADLEGLRDMARECGIRTAPSGDASGWVAAVNAALADPRSALASRPPRTWEVVADHYERLFRSALTAETSA